MIENRFVAKVINVADPEKAGRLQIRIYGIHDDPNQIPDSALPWARAVFPVTNPVHQGVAGASTGMVPGATVVGFFADPNKQIPLVDGTLGRGDDTSDFPSHDRGQDVNPVSNNSIVQVGLPGIKSAGSSTIGSIKYVGQDITQMISQISSGDLSSALKSAKDSLSSFNKLKATVQSVPFDQINSVIQGIAGDLGSIAGSSDDITTTNTGTVVSSPTITTSAANTISGTLDTTTNLTGGLGTVTSKLGITNTQDALNRISGSRFVMNNVMPGLDKTLSDLQESIK